ncbi:ribonuclease P 40kDa subunit-domain-containing protein [Scleroderma yunnanense]
MHLRLSSGALPSPHIDQLAASHPFIQQQIDIVFPSSVHFEKTLSSLTTSYRRGQFTLSDFFEQASRTSTSPPLAALPTKSDADDTWCIDPRGVLTLCMSKQPYEQLGLVGEQLSFKGCQELHVIKIPLRKETQSIAVRARQEVAIRTWDELRAQSRYGKWEIAYVGGGASSLLPIRYSVRQLNNVFIPVPELARSKEESKEEWEERVSELFEWVGMACLGAQRLHANDRVDPFVAVYNAPTPSSLGDLTHLRWIGFMDTTFVQTVLTTAASLIMTCPSDKSSFISVTMHSNPMAPVSYIPPSCLTSGVEMKDTPPRVPRPDADDTVCLVLTKDTWLLGQNIGKWDARWG